MPTFSDPQKRLMIYLGRRHDRPVEEGAGLRAANTDPGRAEQTVYSLVRKGLVDRTLHPFSRVTLSLTPAGMFAAGRLLSPGNRNRGSVR